MLCLGAAECASQKSVTPENIFEISAAAAGEEAVHSFPFMSTGFHPILVLCNSLISLHL